MIDAGIARLIRASAKATALFTACAWVESCSPRPCDDLQLLARPTAVKPHA
jgi:hypothetical protein